jgi:predicted MPP superfamily phosphohydrolase
MHISDAHIGTHRGRPYLEQIVRETNRLKPDLVLITGDLVDGSSALEPGVLSPLDELNAPTYFTTGNHEGYIDTERALEIITSHGIRILHNEVVETHGLQLVGLDYMKADEDAFPTREVNLFTIKEELLKIPFHKEKPVILMHHSPVGLEYVTARGVELMLSGHTHAGQAFPATLFTPLVFTLNKGLYKRDKTYFFVSQGAGTFGPRIRLGTSNEINLIRLRVQE